MPDLFNDFFDPGRVDPAVRDEPFQGDPGHLAPQRVEARQSNCLRRVINDNIHPRRRLKRLDISSLFPDDPPLHLIALNVEHAHCRLDAVICGGPLNRLNDDLLGFFLRIHPCGVADFLQHLRRLRLCLIDHILQKNLLRFIAR